MKSSLKVEKDKPVKKTHAQEKRDLKTEPPIAEKDEVKKAEERTNKNK